MISFLLAHPSALAALVFLLGGFLALRLKSTKRLPYPLPPGPPGEPIIGHFRVIPGLNPEHQYIKWGKQYGKFTSSNFQFRVDLIFYTLHVLIKFDSHIDSDILYLNVLGRPIIVINSTKIAQELLNKRGANYADRPRFVLFEV